MDIVDGFLIAMTSSVLSAASGCVALVLSKTNVNSSITCQSTWMSLLSRTRFPELASTTMAMATIRPRRPLLMNSPFSAMKAQQQLDAVGRGMVLETVTGNMTRGGHALLLPSSEQRSQQPLLTAR